MTAREAFLAGRPHEARLRATADYRAALDDFRAGRIDRATAEERMEEAGRVARAALAEMEEKSPQH